MFIFFLICPTVWLTHNGLLWMAYKQKGISSVKLYILYSIQWLKTDGGPIVKCKNFAESSGQLIERDLQIYVSLQQNTNSDNTHTFKIIVNTST